MNIGKALKQLRKERNVSQSDLFKLTNITQTSLSQIEKGTFMPTQKTIAKICEALKINTAVVYLCAIEETDVPESKKEVYNLFYPQVKKMIESIFTE